MAYKKPRKTRTLWTHTKLTSLVREWDNYEATADMAKDLGYCVATIRNARKKLVRAGFNLPYPKPRRGYVDRMIAELREEMDA